MEVIENKPTRLELFRVNRAREKLCQCANPHYEIDTTNRLVTCTDCGAIVDPFEALLTVCKQPEKLKEDIERLHRSAINYSEEANKEFKRMCRGKVFREMESNYRMDLFPACPICGGNFDPINIQSWTNKNILDKKGE